MRSEIVRVVNDSDLDRRVMLEPWAAQIDVPPGGALELDFTGPEDGATETDERGAEVTVYAWSGSTVIATLNGEIVFDASSVPVPSLPAATSMRDFLGRLFGGARTP